MCLLSTYRPKRPQRGLVLTFIDVSENEDPKETQGTGSVTGVTEDKANDNTEDNTKTDREDNGPKATVPIPTPTVPVSPPAAVAQGEDRKDGLGSFKLVQRKQRKVSEVPAPTVPEEKSGGPSTMALTSNNRFSVLMPSTLHVDSTQETTNKDEDASLCGEQV